MTYGELKTRVRQLVFSDSIAGDRIPETYNNQADYDKMIPGLLNKCQSYIYQIKTIEDSIMLKDLESEEFDNDTILYLLPDDCLKVTPGLIVPRGWTRGDVFHRFTKYKLFGGNKILCPKGLPENTIMEYRKRPVPVPENVKDTFVLKNPEEINDLIPFYVAAFVVLYDDPFRYSALYNEFETGLQRLYPNPTYVEDNHIQDVYGGFREGWWWY